jgi:hypothetical protein
MRQSRNNEAMLIGPTFRDQTIDMLVDSLASLQYCAGITILQLLKDAYHLLYGSRRQDFLEWISHMVEVSKFELRSFRWLKGGASP